MTRRAWGGPSPRRPAVHGRSKAPPNAPRTVFNTEWSHAALCTAPAREHRNKENGLYIHNPPSIRFHNTRQLTQAPCTTAHRRWPTSPLQSSHARTTHARSHAATQPRSHAATHARPLKFITIYKTQPKPQLSGEIQGTASPLPWIPQKTRGSVTLAAGAAAAAAHASDAAVRVGAAAQVAALPTQLGVSASVAQLVAVPRPLSR